MNIICHLYIYSCVTALIYWPSSTKHLLVVVNLLEKLDVAASSSKVQLMLKFLTTGDKSNPATIRTQAELDDRILVLMITQFNWIAYFHEAAIITLVLITIFYISIIINHLFLQSYIVKSMLPLVEVEKEGFRDLVGGLAENFIIKHRRFFTDKLKNEFQLVKTRLISALAEAKHVSTTADLWSSRRRTFIGMTVHWLGDDLGRRSAMVNMPLLAFPLNCD